MKTLHLLLLLALATAMLGCGSKPTRIEDFQRPTPPPGTVRFHMPVGARVGVIANQPDPVILAAEAGGEETKFKRDSGIAEAIGTCLSQVKPYRFFLAPVCGLTPLFYPFAPALEQATINAERAFRAERFKYWVNSSLLGLRPLPERIQNLARATGSIELVAVPHHQMRQSGEEQNKHGTGVGYVLEFEPLHVEEEILNNDHRVRVTARGRLVRFEDNAAIDEFTTSILTARVMLPSGPPEEDRRLAAQLDLALDALAEQSLNDWIRKLWDGSQ